MSEAKTDTPVSIERFLQFSLGTEDYAIPLLKVKEVIAVSELTPVPFAPPHFRGIMNLRGQIISVIDLRIKFKMSKADFTQETAIVILDLGKLCFGVIVDCVSSVLAATAAEIAAAPDVESSVKSDYIQGVTRKDNRLVLLLDIEKVLSIEDLKVLKRPAGAVAA